MCLVYFYFRTNLTSLFFFFFLPLPPLQPNPQLSAEVAELDAVVRAKRLWFDEAQSQYDAERNTLTACDKQLTALAKERKRMQTAVTDKELEGKKQAHKVQRLISDQSEAKSLVQNLQNKYEWLAAEKHLFGVAGGDYDFAVKKPAEAAERLKKLKSEQESLGKKINKKVMGMFEKAEQEYTDLMKKRAIIDKDKQKVRVCVCVVVSFGLASLLFLFFSLSIFLISQVLLCAVWCVVCAVPTHRSKR
jgi:hypothetical protein